MRARLTYWFDTALVLMVVGFIRIVWDKPTALRWYDTLKPEAPSTGTEPRE